MAALFSTLIYQPILNAFVFLYTYVPDVGIVIFLLTLAVRLLLFPLTKQSIVAQKSMTDLQPKIEALKQKYKDDQQTLARETMNLYKEHKVNPFGSCLPLILQIPIFLGLFYVLRDIFSLETLPTLYPFIHNPGSISPISLGFFDLSNPSIVLAILAGGAQFLQIHMLSSTMPPKDAGAGAKDESVMAQMNKQMKVIMPIMITVISLTFPGGLALYWFSSTALMIGQQYLMFHGSKKSKKDTDIIDGTLVS